MDLDLGIDAGQQGGHRLLHIGHCAILVSLLRCLHALALLGIALALAGCGGDDDAVDQSPPGTQPASPPDASARLEPARCPAGAANCRSADGTIAYVEAVDPDGDGDAHFVLVSDESVTAPGLTVVDVRRGLRPRPLPGPGDRISAAGPVYRGSFGQRQIEADVVHVARD